MSIGTHAEHYDIEYGEAGGVLGGKGLDQLRLVFVRKLVEVSKELGIDTVNISFRNSDFGQELVIYELVVGFWIIKWDGTLVREVDMPSKHNRFN